MSNENNEGFATNPADAGDEGIEIDRRNVLKAAGVGVAGVGLNGTAAGQASSGELVWEFNTGSVVRISSPTVVDGTVYIGSGDPGAIEAEGTLYAVDAETGEMEWEFDPEDDIVSSPTVIDGTVYVGDFGSGSSGVLYAVDADTGDEDWRYTDCGGITASPTLVEGTVYLASEDGFLYAVDADTGEADWEFEVDENDIDSSPTVVGGTVYFGSNSFQSGTTYAVDAETGEMEWDHQAENSVRSSPTVYDGTVFVGSSDDSLYALDADTGDEEWSFETGGSITSSPTAWDGLVYIGSRDDYVYAVDPDTGEMEWEYESETSIFRSSATVADGVVYIGDAQGHVSAIDAKTGDGVWVWEDPTSTATFSSSPTVADGIVYIGYENSSFPRLFAIKAEGSGSSEGSRVSLGTLGHTDTWDGTAQDAWPPVDTGTMAGTVTDEDGQSIEGVSVTLSTDGDDEDTVETDPSGEYEAEIPVGTYEITAEADGFLPFEDSGVTVTENETTTVDIELIGAPSALPGQDNPPQDLDGDGLYEDLNGDGALSIADIQLLFQNRNTGAVQDTPEAFNFSETDPQTVSLDDVQALYQDFAENN